ncbi:hypothetical protein T4E_11419, partial [Trichinella pseudospiralis]
LCTSTYLADVELKDNFWKTDANVMDEILPKNSLLLNNVTLIILLINGILALIINPKVNNYFNAGFISGNIVASAGYVCCSARRLFFTTGNKNATRLECIVESWNILPFMSGLFFSCLNLLLIAVERFYKVLRPYKCNYFNNKVRPTLLYTALVITSIIIMFVLIDALLSASKNNYINDNCFIIEVIPMQFYIGFWAFYVSVYYMTMLIYFFIYFLIVFQKKNKVSGVRAIQAQREAVVTKRIFILAVFCFIIQALPLTVLLAIHKRSFIYFDRLLRFLENLNLFFIPIVFIFTNPCYYKYVRQILLKYRNLCSCSDFIGI